MSILISILSPNKFTRKNENYKRQKLWKTTENNYKQTNGRNAQPYKTLCTM